MTFELSKAFQRLFRREAGKSDPRAYSQRAIVLVVHDAYQHGAQYTALNIARWIARQLGCRLHVVLLGPGPMKDDFAATAIVHDLTGINQSGQEAWDLAKRLLREGCQTAICNSTASGLFLETLSIAGLRCIALVHELPDIIHHYGFEPHTNAIRAHAATTIFPSSYVRDRFPGGAPQNSLVNTQGLYKSNPLRMRDMQKNRADLRETLGIPADAQIVLNVGYGDMRKGIDLFINLANRTAARLEKAYFIWVGSIAPEQKKEITLALAASPYADRIVLAGFREDTDLFYAGADVFALTSREDPFPSVIMEALDVGVPVIGFDGAGGFNQLLADGAGILVPSLDVAAFTEAAYALLTSPAKRDEMGAHGKQQVAQNFSFHKYVSTIMSIAWGDFLRVSVVVPNFNYGDLIKYRIRSILNQSYPIFELIILDDYSTDNSVPEINKYLKNESLDWRLVVNERNSGSPFRQWLKGTELAKGDIVWIAEADDLSEPGFIEETIRAFERPSVMLSYCQSNQMGPSGEILDDYLQYVSAVDPRKWRSPYVNNGVDEIRTAFSIKNTIPNVSACLFRRNPLYSALCDKIDMIASYKNAGDWAAYLELLRNGEIAFIPSALNKHRRHSGGVTLGAFNENMLREILSMQKRVRQEFGPIDSSAAEKYAQELYRQFALDTPEAPSIRDHAAFMEFF